MNNFLLTTSKNYEDFQFYVDFMKSATPKEFCKSQSQFYEAVADFPKLLCHLASIINSGEDRLLIVKNINDEHGHGDKNMFHTETFKRFLKSLDEDFVISSNVKVNRWINSIKNNDIYKLSLNLAAIELLYAHISNAISEYCSENNIIQDHYVTHAKLDISHGEDLLNIALKYSKENEEEMLRRFTQYQESFIDVYRSMLVLTNNKCKKISNEPISFYYTREDPSIVNHAVGITDDILLIGSGGETLFNILKRNNFYGNIHVVDMNNNQLELIKEKYNKILNGEKIEENNKGKFELIFKEIRSRFNKKEWDTILFDEKREELFNAISDIFSKDNLCEIFGEDAVKYSKQSFSDHFYKVFCKQANEYDRQNFANIFEEKSFNYDNVSNYENIFYHNLNINSTDFIDLINSNNFDVVDISNIGDWIPKEDLYNLIKSIYSYTNNYSALVARRLLGDYSLENILKSIGYNTDSFEDSFYKETIIGSKYV